MDSSLFHDLPEPLAPIERGGERFEVFGLEGSDKGRSCITLFEPVDLHSDAVQELVGDLVFGEAGPLEHLSYTLAYGVQEGSRWIPHHCRHPDLCLGGEVPVGGGNRYGSGAQSGQKTAG